MISAILFDMNGVIIDDEQIHQLAFRQVCQEYNILLTHQNYLNLCSGKTDREGFLEIQKRFKKKLDIDKSVLQKSKFYLKLFPQYKKSYPGVIKLIKNLHLAYTLALTSSSSRAEVNLILKVFLLKKYFSVTVSANDISHGKPHPEPYLLTAQKLKIPPDACMAIEDSPSGIISAKKAGMKCIAITTTHSKASLSLADKIVSEFSQIDNQLIKLLN